MVSGRFPAEYRPYAILAGNRLKVAGNDNHYFRKLRYLLESPALRYNAHIWNPDAHFGRKTVKNRDFWNFEFFVEISERVEISARSEISTES